MEECETPASRCAAVEDDRGVYSICEEVSALFLPFSESNGAVEVEGHAE